MHLYSFFAHEVHRDWLQQFEREAELRRMLPKRESRRFPRPHFPAARRRQHTRLDPRGCR